HAAFGGLGQRLDLALEHPHLDPLAVLGVSLGVTRARRDRGVHRAPREPLALCPHETAAPPTVSSRIRTWPWPVPTGTRCPSLPQNPVLISKSFATASIPFNASRQLPIRVAPRHGLVTLPPSLRQPP